MTDQNATAPALTKKHNRSLSNLSFFLLLALIIYVATLGVS